ncbi:DUF2922 domain-containing protein [Coprothermobacter platensis]|uniref:DUF2922 domain-containing protein n=1 Tax=Coprothermobacter platensis TaxID=108819 RepID=UPI000367D751|nr:DUF2922 domain-containing protein [Coprothermobacter platensis]
MVTLNLSFKTNTGKTMVLRIPDPIMNLTTQQIQDAANAIIASNVLLSEKLGRPSQLVDANYVERNATDMLP